MVPLTIRVHDELPRVGAVDLNDWGKAKDSAETVGQRDASAWERAWVVFTAKALIKDKKTKDKIHMSDWQITLQSGIQI